MYRTDTHLQEVWSSYVDDSSTEQRLLLSAMSRRDDEAVHSSHLFNRGPAGRAVSSLADYPHSASDGRVLSLPLTGNTAARPARHGTARQHQLLEVHPV